MLRQRKGIPDKAKRRRKRDVEEERRDKLQHLERPDDLLDPLSHFTDALTHASKSSPRARERTFSSQTRRFIFRHAFPDGPLGRLLGRLHGGLKLLRLGELAVG